MAIVIKRELIIKRKLFIVPTADFVNCVKVAMRILELTSVCFWYGQFIMEEKTFLLISFPIMDALLLLTQSVSILKDAEKIINIIKPIKGSKLNNE